MIAFAALCTKALLFASDLVTNINMYSECHCLQLLFVSARGSSGSSALLAARLRVPDMKGGFPALPVSHRLQDQGWLATRC